MPIDLDGELGAETPAQFAAEKPLEGHVLETTEVGGRKPLAIEIARHAVEIER